MFDYRAKLLRVIDGDTIEVSIDLGFDIWINQRVRLNGIDTPEIRTKNELEKQASTEVKFFLEKLLKKELTLVTIKESDKYGRYLADIYIEGKCINDFLLEFGLARECSGKREEWSDQDLKGILSCLEKLNKEGHYE